MLVNERVKIQEIKFGDYQYDSGRRIFTEIPLFGPTWSLDLEAASAPVRVTRKLDAAEW